MRTFGFFGVILFLLLSCDQRPQLDRLKGSVAQYTWREHEVGSFSAATPEICESIPKYETRWPIWNPTGYQVMFARSWCFSSVAEKLKNKQLCLQVKELKSPFLDGSAISKEACLSHKEEQR